MWCVTWMGEVIDACDTEQCARDRRSDIYMDVKSGKLPDFLDPDDVKAVGDFGIEFRAEVQ